MALGGGEEIIPNLPSLNFPGPVFNTHAYSKCKGETNAWMVFLVLKCTETSL
jgi:hypothetical protein